MQLYEGQKTYGNYNEQYAHLRESVLRAVESGAATAQEYQATLLQLLRAVNLLEAKNKAALDRLNGMVAYHTAMANGCSLLGNLVLNVVDARLRERERIIKGAETLAWREIREDRDRIADLRAGGQEAEADALEQDVAQREAELRNAEALAAGSEIETEITKRVVGEIVKTLGGGEWEEERAPGGGVFVPPPNPVVNRNPRLFEGHTVPKVIEESLQEHALDAKNIVEEAETKKRSRKRKKSDA